MNFASFDRIYWVLLGLGLVPLAWWYWRYRYRAYKAFYGKSLVGRFYNRTHNRQRFIGISLLVTAALLFSVALVQPLWGTHWVERPTRHSYVFLVVDISKSMWASDVNPDRLTVMRRKLVDLIKMAKGDSIGLIAFSGSAQVLCPMTTDYQALTLFYKALEPDLLSGGGTAIEEAIQLAAQHMQGVSGAKNILIMSDGENHLGDPIKAARAANKAGIHVQVLAIGTEQGSPVSVPDQGLLKDKQDNLVISRLNLALLKDIAKAGGGELMQAGIGDADLQQLYFKAMQREVIEESKEPIREQAPVQRFQLFLFLGLMCLAIEMYYGTR